MVVKGCIRAAGPQSFGCGPVISEGPLDGACITPLAQTTHSQIKGPPLNALLNLPLGKVTVDPQATQPLGTEVRLRGNLT